MTLSETEFVTPAPGDETAAILLAEDDPVTRMLMTRFLKKAGYQVDAVADGAQALELMKKRYYPILVSDWEMPDMDGLALCKAVRSLPLDGYVYVLLLTARDTKENIIAGLDAGADDYLVKPIHEAELVARLNSGRRILALEHSLRAANQRNRVLSMTDALTGAFNRRHLMEQLPREVERCRRYGYPLSLVMCDIDHFKNINDQKGHAAGDEVLQQFVGRMQRSIRSTSDWVSRYGGEEFVIVLPDTQFKDGLFVAEKIRKLISAAVFPTTMGELAVTASFGVSATGPDGPDLVFNIDALIRAADECLYQSKQNGRDRSTGSLMTRAMAWSATG